MTVRATLALLTVLVFGVLAIWQGTDGFTAFTTEAALRLDVARRSRPLPPVDVQDASGAATTLAAFRGRVVLLDFIYTHCPTLCVALGSSFEQLRARIATTDLRGNVVLVSLSFDPDNDLPEQLSDYANRFGGADATWRFLRPLSKRQLAELLRVTEVIVRPDGAGGFVHNAAINVIDRRGRLIGIVDTDDVTDALALARASLQSSEQ